jgi:MFS family permease
MRRGNDQPVHRGRLRGRGGGKCVGGHVGPSQARLWRSFTCRPPPAYCTKIGNVFEWFDFVVYGFFAVTLAEVFFPTGNPTVSLLVTFGAFGLAYVVRPLGAIVVGGYTDRVGRKAGLLLSMALMMIGTTMMAVTPGYATIGLAAPIIITIARLLQGFSVGGEYGSAVTFLAELRSLPRNILDLLLRGSPLTPALSPQAGRGGLHALGSRAGHLPHIPKMAAMPGYLPIKPP